VQQPGRLALRQGLPSAAAVTIDVYGVRGARVRGLLRSEQVAGEHFVPLDGTDDRGHVLANGVYFARLEARGPGVRASLTRRFTLLRQSIRRCGLDTDAPARQAAAPGVDALAALQVSHR